MHLVDTSAENLFADPRFAGSVSAAKLATPDDPWLHTYLVRCPGAGGQLTHAQLADQVYPGNVGDAAARPKDTVRPKSVRAEY